MDEAPRRAIPWLLTVGIAVLLLGLTGVSPLILGARSALDPRVQDTEVVVLRLVFSVLLALLGVGMILSCTLKACPIPKAAVIFGVIVILLAAVSSYAVFLVRASRFDPFVLCSLLSGLIIQPGIPFLWGTALVRRDHSGDLQAQQLGRIGAGLVQLGFIFVFISELRSFGGYDGQDSTAVLHGLQRLVGLVERVLLLWASIESVRSASDDDVLRRRALKIHKLLLAWFGLMLVHAALGFAAYPDIVYGWHSLGHWILSPAVALIVAKRFDGRYKSSAPAHP